MMKIVSETEDKLHFSVRPPAAAGPATDVDPVGIDDGEDEPFYFGWRWEEAPDGSRKLRQVPLTYDDLLSPEVGDFIAEDTIHRRVTVDIAKILERRYADEPTVAVWSDLKISFRIPGLTTGPGPDVCVVEGVVDRDRRRSSFRYGEEPGEVVLTVEVVSKKSAPKDYRDILEIYTRLGVKEYLAIRPIGHYADGPFELKGWRRDPRSGRLEPIAADGEGRLRLRTTALLVGTGTEGWGLEVWDAATGERLRSPDEETAFLELRAEQARARAEQEAAARRAAEERAEQEAARAGQAEARAGQAEERAEQAEERVGQEAAARRAAEEKIERLLARLAEREAGDE